MTRPRAALVALTTVALALLGIGVRSRLFSAVAEGLPAAPQWTEGDVITVLDP